MKKIVYNAVDFTKAKTLVPTSLHSLLISEILNTRFNDSDESELFTTCSDPSSSHPPENNL